MEDPLFGWVQAMGRRPIHLSNSPVTLVTRIELEHWPSDQCYPFPPFDLHCLTLPIDSLCYSPNVARLGRTAIYTLFIGQVI